MSTSNLRIWLRFFGSMNLAITLLIAIAIAAVIGTVVQQNQPYPDYVLKFGPFWFEVFQKLELFNVYSSPGFLTILAFLVLSTGVCVYRNLPRMWRDVGDFHEHAQRQTLERLGHQACFISSQTIEQLQPHLSELLARHRYGFRQRDTKHGRLLAAKKGEGSRFGYVFSHTAIIIICIGGLLDGNLPLKIAEWQGQLAVETRRIPASEIPAISTLTTNNPSFRANIDIAEGGRSDLAFIDYKEGYLLQKLPFTIQVDDFRIAHYPSGQPKSFESDLTLFDPARAEPLKQTISVNHPLHYKGYSIFQNSFGDGGSRLALTVWPLSDASNPLSLSAEVKQHSELAGHILEISDFRPFNVNPDPSGTKQFINYGPSFQFKLRKPNGVANEYLNFMQPIRQDGRFFYLTGMRSKPSEPFNYWHLPADTENRLDRFMAFQRTLHDAGKLRQLAEQTARAGAIARQSSPAQQQAVTELMLTLARQFIDGGYAAISASLEHSAPESERQAVFRIYADALQQLLKNVYLDVLQQQGVATNPLSDFDNQFYNDAVTALDQQHFYDAPLYLALQSFKHIEATGLQITRSPGRWLVFPGCLLLVLGVFCMLYLPQRRLWLLLEPQGAETLIFLGGSALRNRYDFDREFQRITQDLAQSATLTA